MNKITDKDVYVYRELYYETQKPLMKAGASPEFIKEMLVKACEGFGWTIEKYDSFSALDLMQRIARATIRTASEDKILVQTSEGKNVKYHASLDMPELKCPIRNEEGKYL